MRCVRARNNRNVGGWQVDVDDSSDPIAEKPADALQCVLTANVRYWLIA
jgi:hypothetical protein